ncbi:uncharacterized protein PGRI_055060 [Penicillium griseofulvum]|uniref:Uncharacterized protein n=1 Tax=Penicillium patulum TaxID=5078 RepID=A0A135LCP8_PENPA|nr:uncharacterized protein PGRI_055060 [Penicillium griseofulvum]KXG46650.1 hypothetical protein PGRI_055060 [Penicillium griseofulvum]
MSLQTAPYDDSMRIGSGFNSYTQQLCIDNAVVNDDKGLATEKDLKPKLPETNGDGVSQQVTFTSKFVENSSDITEAMNVSGHLEIKWNGVGVSGSGSYIDSSKVKDSDISYFVQVKVINQQLIAEDLTRFNAIANVSPTDRSRFTEIYGDSFVSGFLEGGEFNALLSVKVADKSKVKEIKGALSLSLEKGGFGISGSAEGEYDTEEILKNSETSITVSWAGGSGHHNGTPENKGWTIESMAKAAFSFADRVRACPQRTQAILTKYSALRSYQLQTNKGSPLDYENAGVYTNALLEFYMEYKSIAKDIQKMTQEVSDGVSNLVELPAGQAAAEAIKQLKIDYAAIINAGKSEQAYTPNLFSLETARLHCRLQMVRIVKEVDAVAEDPEVAVDPHRVGQFLNPMIFRQLLPGIEPRPSEQELKDMQRQITELECQLDTEVKNGSTTMETVANLQKQLEGLKTNSGTSEQLKEVERQITELQCQLDTEVKNGSTTMERVAGLQKKSEELGDKLDSHGNLPWNLFRMMIGDKFLVRNPTKGFDL